jgi:hypothetical protein
MCVHGHQDRLVVHHASALKDIESELALNEEEFICLMLYEDPQKMVKMAEVQGKFLLEGRYGMIQERYAGCGEHNVINIKQQVYRISVVMEDENGGVGLGLNKSQSEEVRGEPAVPSSMHLLQPVEGLVEVTDLVRLRGINKPHQLTTVDCI